VSKDDAAEPSASRTRVFDRPLVRGIAFVAAGALLHLAHAFFADPEPGPLIEVTPADVERLEQTFVKQAGRRPDAELRDRLIEQEIDERLLVLEARARGWHRSDPVIQRRLIQNQRFLSAAGTGGESTDETADDAMLLALAYDQGMDRTDVVVKRRLLERMRLAVAEASRREAPGRDELEAYRLAHLELFRRPARVDLVQVFLSRDRHGDALDAAARALGERLAADGFDDDAAVALGDPSLLPARVTGASRDELARRFGHAFAAEAFDAPTEAFTGPIASSFGLHFVRARARTPERDPPLDEVEAAVRSRVEREREQAALTRLTQTLRSRAVIRRPDAPS